MGRNSTEQEPKGNRETWPPQAIWLRLLIEKNWWDYSFCITINTFAEKNARMNWLGGMYMFNKTLETKTKVGLHRLQLKLYKVAMKHSDFWRKIMVEGSNKNWHAYSLYKLNDRETGTYVTKKERERNRDNKITWNTSEYVIQGTACTKLLQIFICAECNTRLQHSWTPWIKTTT